ncbi:MAG: hypothetical protein KTR15_10855 [Phycisphaeraceae bacterium]|nr:hypothetical protein [Phycisphaeraceae bacterium]
MGKADDSPRDWVMSMGGHPAKLRDGRVVPKDTYDERVLRDKRYKAWVDGKGQVTKLYDMSQDPWEATNLIDSKKHEHLTAIYKFDAVLGKFPEEDAGPAYKKNPPQSWDRKQ